MAAGARRWSWDRLRRATLTRQFPRVRGRGVPAVAAMVARIGPVQTQTARSAFLGLAARLPGLSHATLTAAYEGHAVVRGSVHRGTVHTAAPEQHVLLDRATRLGRRRLWERTFRLTDLTVDEVWQGLESYAADAWRTPDELHRRLFALIDGHADPTAPGLSGRVSTRSLAFGHGGLIRRPLSGGWEGQGRPGYRAAAATLAEARPELTGVLDGLRALDDEQTVRELVLLHLSAHGPATEADVVWWSGLGVRPVRAAIDGLGARLKRLPGPDGLEFLDVADQPSRGTDDVGTRLLPEFDALLCGYRPALRTRFVSAENHRLLWNQLNALLLAPVLHRGRLAGTWRLTGGAVRRLEVRRFADAPTITVDDLEPAAQDVATVLGIRIGDVDLA